MKREYAQLTWNSEVADDCRRLVELAAQEDLGAVYDWTTAALVGPEVEARALVVARRAGVVAGLPACQLVLEVYDHRLRWHPLVEDGTLVAAGQTLADISGPARSLLTAERPLLNLLGHLSGVATLTRHYVEAVAHTQAKIYDTRKTMPGLRRLDKYAVRCGGGQNHRTGLFDGILIKDNHLAFGASSPGAGRFTPADAVRRAREFLAAMSIEQPWRELLVEIEVDTLDQLREVLPAEPDIVLLDNMNAARLAEAVALRDATGAQTELEASGGVSLESVGTLAASGVERISVGALTHSVTWLDVGLDWPA